jgi:hypothetical protein
MTSNGNKHTLHRAARAVIVLVAGAALALGGATTASAESLNGVCESGEGCQWRLSSQSGGVVDQAGTISNYANYTYRGTDGTTNGYNADNRASALKCRGNSYDNKFWQHKDQGGWQFRVYRGASWNLAEHEGGDYDNRISGMSWYDF